MNPLFFDEVQTVSNHAPTLEGVDPAPGFSALIAKIGDNCIPATFRAARLDDADRDPLTVRWSLLVERAGVTAGARERFEGDERQLDPLEEPPPGGPFYDFPAFELTRAKLEVALDPAVLAAQEAGARTQLLELRISDGGFVVGTDEAPEGKHVLFLSWLIDLEGASCTAP